MAPPAPATADFTTRRARAIRHSLRSTRPRAKLRRAATRSYTAATTRPARNEPVADDTVAADELLATGAADAPHDAVGLFVWQYDFKTAFLNSPITDEEIYGAQPHGFEKTEVNGKRGKCVCKLEKGLYGLKQSPPIKEVPDPRRIASIWWL